MRFIVFLFVIFYCSCSSVLVNKNLTDNEIVFFTIEYICNNYYWTEHNKGIIKYLLYPKNVQINICILQENNIGYSLVDFFIGPAENKYKIVVK